VMQKMERHKLRGVVRRPIGVDCANLVSYSLSQFVYNLAGEAKPGLT
jgi:hypothetical protein